MIYSSYVAFYLLLLIVWNGLQTVFDMGMKTISKRCYAFLYHDVKIILLIALIIAYPGQITISSFQASREVYNYIKTTVLFVFFFFFMFLYFATIGLICELKRKLLSIYEDKKLSDDLVTKYINYQGQNQTDERERNNSIEFLNEMIQQNLLVIVENYVLNKNTCVDKDNNTINNANNEQENDRDICLYDINDESEYGMDYEKEILKFDTYRDTNYELEIESDNNNNKNNNIPTTKLSKERNISFKRKESKSSPIDKKKKFELTKNDLDAMNKIFGMSYWFLIMTMIILSLSCSLSFQDTNHSPASIYIIICVGFIAEIASIGIIYSLFFRTLKSQEYQNLKIIGEIDKYLNQKQESKPKIVYNEFTNKDAFRRFKSYVKESK